MLVPNANEHGLAFLADMYIQYPVNIPVSVVRTVKSPGSKALIMAEAAIAPII